MFRGREGHRTLKTGATEQKPILGASDANPRRLPRTFAIMYLLWVHEQDKVRVKKKNLPFLGLLARRCFESFDSRPLRSYPWFSLRPVCGKKRERRRKCVLSDHVGLIEKNGRSPGWTTAIVCDARRLAVLKLSTAAPTLKISQDHDEAHLVSSPAQLAARQFVAAAAWPLSFVS